MRGGGFGGMGGGRMGGGPGGGGGRLRSALDAADQADLLGKIYDFKVIRRMPKYLEWVKKYIAAASIGTLMRTFANIAMPYIVGITADNYIKTKNFTGLDLAVLVYVGFALLMYLGQYLETLFLSY